MTMVVDVWSMPRTRLWQFCDQLRTHLWAQAPLLAPFHELMNEQAAAVSRRDPQGAHDAFRRLQKWIDELAGDEDEVRLQVFDQPGRPTRLLVRVLGRDPQQARAALADQRWVERICYHGDEVGFTLDEVQAGTQLRDYISSALDHGRFLLTDVVTREDVQRRAWSNGAALSALLDVPPSPARS